MEQSECSVGCDVNPVANKLGVMIVNGRGVEKELSWKLAGYHVRCDDSPGFEEW